MVIVVVFVLVLFVIFVASGCFVPAYKKNTEDLDRSNVQCPVNCSEEELLKMDEKGLQSFSKEDLEEIVNFSGHKVHDAGEDANEWRNLYEKASKVMYQH